MLRFTSFFILIIFSVFSCKRESKLEDLILSLKSQEQKEHYLSKIFDEDQEVRNPDRKLEILKRNNYDMKSEEFMSYRRNMIHMDSINFIKISKYLKTYGYPTFETSKAKSAINAVFLHQSLEKQMMLFPYLYKGYKDGYIGNKTFSFLLNRMYIMKFGKSHPQAITEEKNIEQLLNELKINK